MVENVIITFRKADIQHGEVKITDETRTPIYTKEWI